MRLGMAEAWRLGAGLVDGRMQVSGCGPGRSRLGGVLLGLAQLGDGGGQGDELGHERDGHQRVVAGQVPGQRDHPGRAPQLLAVVAAPGDPPVLGAGGAVVGVGRAPQVRVAQRPRRAVQCVGGRPGGIGRAGRIGHGAAADVFRGGPGLAGRVPVDLVPFRGGEPRRSGTFRRLPVAGSSDPAAGAG